MVSSTKLPKPAEKTSHQSSFARICIVQCGALRCRSRARNRKGIRVLSRKPCISSTFQPDHIENSGATQKKQHTSPDITEHSRHSRKVILQEREHRLDPLLGTTHQQLGFPKNTKRLSEAAHRQKCFKALWQSEVKCEPLPVTEVRGSWM